MNYKNETIQHHYLEELWRYNAYAFSIYFPAISQMHFSPNANNSLEKVIYKLSRELESRCISQFDHKFQTESWFLFLPSRMPQILASCKEVTHFLSLDTLRWK